jgi:hypothetical protein
MSIDQSLTATTKSFLDGQQTFAPAFLKVEDSYESILEVAQAAGLTLQQYVITDPERAIRQAEAALATWLKVQSSAAIEGCIATNSGTHTINKNTAKLIQLRCEQAEKHLDKVNEYALTAYSDGERRKDHLIRTLYNRAIHKGDTRAITYLIDRVDGRPGESKVADLDYDNAYNVYQIIHSLFDKQLQVLNAGNGTIMLCTSRRAGKSHLLTAISLIEALRRPNTTIIYIGETSELTEAIINSAMNEIIETCQLRDIKGKRLNWKHLDNGSKIMVRGLSSTKDPDQIRGFKAPVIVIDEFFHLKDHLLEYLQREVLQPMQMDYADNYKFICAGTPPSIKGTFGEYAWKTWDCPKFQWTFRENPHPLDPKLREEYVEKILAEKGLDWTSTFARREYNGEWIYDEDLLLYPEYHTYNPRDAIPILNVDQVLFGIDYGISDSDTLIGIAWDNAQRRGYVFHEDKFCRLDIKDRTISQLQYLHGQVQYAWEKALEFFPNLDPKEANKRILWDADDSDQHVTDDLNCNVRLEAFPTLRLNIQNAHKTDKVIMFDKIRDLLRTGSLLLIESGKTVQECEQTVLKRGPQGQVYPEVDHKIYHPDLLPAMRYALYNVIGMESAPSNKGDYIGDNDVDPLN